MVVLDSRTTAEVMNWLLDLTDPWASAGAVDTAPPIAELAPVLNYLVGEQHPRSF